MTFSGTESSKQKQVYWKLSVQVTWKSSRSALCLAHGNAEVERRLSENKRTVTSDRTLLSESSLNGLRMIKDTVNTQAEGKVHMMPISNELKQDSMHIKITMKD